MGGDITGCRRWKTATTYDRTIVLTAIVTIGPRRTRQNRWWGMRPKNLQRALRLLDPVEARIMREVWSGDAQTPFVVADVHARMPEFAYTIVMTTVARLADKGVLEAEQAPGQPVVSYHVAATPKEFLYRSSRERLDELVRLSNAALAAQRDQAAPVPPYRLVEVIGIFTLLSILVIILLIQATR